MEYAVGPTSLVEGYDSVAYFTIGMPTLGLPDIEYEWDERRYRFSRPGHRELFKADPLRYAPQFGEFCGMALAEGDAAVVRPCWTGNCGPTY
jgi:hypothetical protein